MKLFVGVDFADLQLGAGGGGGGGVSRRKVLALTKFWPIAISAPLYFWTPFNDLSKFD